MLYSFIISLVIYFQLNTICVEITYTPDLYLQGKVMVVPIQDDTPTGITLDMWYDYANDTLYPYNKACLQCVLVGITPIECHE